MDSPALNPHSRLVLVPLAPTRLPPSVINVSGPGPIESHSSNLIDESPPPPPPASEKRLPTPQANGTKEEESTEGDGSDRETAAPRANDPYANLDGAFGNYLVDEPRPMTATAGRGRNDLDDLLF